LGCSSIGLVSLKRVSGTCAANEGKYGSEVWSFHAKASTPVTFSSEGTTGNGYNVFLTAEKL